MQKQFRLDINGLRAWAVIAVLLFHFQIIGFSGGFVGVDIFFVISGYLMTRIIVTGLETEYSGGRKFSLFEFYLSRASRIVPMLLVVSSVMMVFGWFFLIAPTDDYRDLGREILYAILFISNYKYWLNGREIGGYFADSEAPRWFLHSWSLSVEWQFYLILPVVLLLLWRLFPSRKAALTMLSVGFGASFLLSLIQIKIGSELSFFSLHTRAWEMLAGGLVYLLFDQKYFSNKRGIYWLGVAIVIITVFLPFNEKAWPGWQAVIPVLGTCLVLVANYQTTFLTSNPAMQYVGKISYSLYLWHWPIVVGLDYFYLEGLPWVWVGLVMTFCLSVLSYELIETKLRKRITFPRRPFVTSFVLALISVVPFASAMGIKVTGGFHERLEIGSERIQGVKTSISERANYHPRREQCHIMGATEPSKCRYGGQKLGLILWGDSHANAALAGVEHANPDPNNHILDLTTPGCVFVPGAERSRKGYNCQKFSASVLSELDKLPSDVPLLIVSKNGGIEKQGSPDFQKDGPFFPELGELPEDEFINVYKTRQVEAICKIAQDRDVWMTKPIPEMTEWVPQYRSRRMALGVLDHDIHITLDEYTEKHKLALFMFDEVEEKCGVKTLDPTEFLCRDGKCMGATNGVPNYYDDDHLSVSGAKVLTPMFERIWIDQ